MRPASLRSSLLGLSRPLDRTPSSSGGVFFCPSCATCRRRARRAFTTTSTSGSGASNDSVNGPLGRSRARDTYRAFTTATTATTVPPRFRELHAALSRVGESATDRVDLSRLQLALRGLEVEEPLVRVAVLGLNDTTAGRRLVRLLLSDPLAPKEEWEGLLNGPEMDISQGLLIRYGEKAQTIPNNLLPTITIPSPLLQNGNLEILVSSLGAEALPSNSPLSAESFLVPTVTIRTSHSGRHNVVRYPVHRSIICGSGVDDLLAYSSLIGRSDLRQDAESVYGAIDLPVPGEKTDHNDRVAFVDIGQAEEALDKFRESVQHATAFERGWLDSGVMSVVNWLSNLQATGQSATEEKQLLLDQLDPSLRTLIVSLLEAAAEGVQAKEAQRLQEQAAGSVSEETRVELSRSVTEWAERAHSELRSSLDAGFASTRWKGLAWWKLFWRVDDVGMVTSEILERRYLTAAEREVIWTAGQFHQAGVPHQKSTGTGTPTGIMPWPRQISTSRSHLLGTTVPALQALAQRLVLFSMSTTTLTSALSALTYISVSSATVYETCTMAAVGLMYSLRRQQTKWEAARTFWEDEVRDEGRAALRETEEELQRAVQASKPSEVVIEVEAREGITKAWEVLTESGPSGSAAGVVEEAPTYPKTQDPRVS